MGRGEPIHCGLRKGMGSLTSDLFYGPFPSDFGQGQVQANKPWPRPRGQRLAGVEHTEKELPPCTFSNWKEQRLTAGEKIVGWLPALR